jgi:hypothetical protein
VQAWAFWSVYSRRTVGRLRSRPGRAVLSLTRSCPWAASVLRALDGLYDPGLRALQAEIVSQSAPELVQLSAKRVRLPGAVELQLDEDVDRIVRRPHDALPAYASSRPDRIVVEGLLPGLVVAHSRLDLQGGHEASTRGLLTAGEKARKAEPNAFHESIVWRHGINERRSE